MRKRAFIFAIVLPLLSSCSSRAVAPSSQSSGVYIPGVVQQQGGGPWIAFPIPDSPTFGITAGPDGAVWYCDEADNALRRVDMSGAGTPFDAPDHGFCSAVITGADKSLYFGETDTTLNESGIARMTTSGSYTFYPAIQNTSQNAWGIATGGDGHVWALANGMLWRLNDDGSITTFQGFYGGVNSELVTGTDGNLWTYNSHNPSVLIRIGLDGSETQIPVSKIWGVAAGSDGGMWFGEGDKMGRIDPSTLAIVTYPIPRSVHPYSMTEGPAGILYFLDTKSSPFTLGRFNTRTHRLLASETLSGNEFNKLTVGPDNNVWIDEHQRLQLDVFVTKSITTTPTSLSIPFGQSARLSAKEKFFSGSLQAQSSNSGVAIATSNGKDAWTVNGVGIGSCVITISDNSGNSIDVPVTVN